MMLGVTGVSRHCLWANGRWCKVNREVADSIHACDRYCTCGYIGLATLKLLTIYTKDSVFDSRQLSLPSLFFPFHGL